ncbi:MAG: PQQ-binding-like beta-propeller repeat protein [Planctomycetota bacterium]|nr:PQQ-binding-like beta-propeller repeat protein [Planctomycetota bacterium]
MKHIFALCLPLCLLLAAVGRAQQELPEGISLLEDRSLATKLDDARAYLADERWEAAVGLLQEVADAEKSAVISYGGGLFMGAVHHANQLIADLPEQAQVFRQQMLADRAKAELLEAMSPPDLARLTSIAHRYQGTPSGDHAVALLSELWRDRGYQDLADSFGAPALSPILSAALPAPQPQHEVSAPVFSSIGASELPRLDSEGIRPAWNFRFKNADALQDLGHRMAFGHGLGFATNGREVVALDLGSGLPRWHFLGPEGWADLGRNQDDAFSGGASPYTMYAPVLADGILLAVIQEPVAIGRVDQYSRIDIRKMMPARRLYAFNALSGEVLWRQEAPWMNELKGQPHELAASPPAIAGGKVYLPIYSAAGTVDLSLLCLDLHTGERLWKSFLTSGTMETNLFGNILTELATPPPVADLDRVIVCSHFGTICAVDANHGQALWTRTYPRTEVHTRQNGTVSSRKHYFRNNPLAYDGRTVVVAPIDSFFALAINAEDGDLLDLWEARADSVYGVMAHLIGMDRNGAWFSGTHIVRQPFQSSGSTRLRISPALYEFANSDSSNLHPGVITHSGVLAMSSRGAAILDPDNLRAQSFAIDRKTMPTTPLGPAQAIHGIVMIMTREGVHALVNPESLLNALASKSLDSATMQELLLVLESADFDNASLGKRLARTAESLAKETRFAKFADDLKLLSGRTWLRVDETRKGLRQLGELLECPNRRLRIAAASLLLDVQAVADPKSSRLQRATMVLLNDAPQRILTSMGNYEPFIAALERSEALVAMASRDKAKQHAELVDVLLLDHPGSLEVRGTPLQDWAKRQLDMLLEEPKVRALHEQAALDLLAGRPITDASLRAFGSTAAMQDWLRAQLDRLRGLTAEYKQMLDWVYRFGSEERTWPEVAEQFQVEPPLPELPAGLEPLNGIRMENAWLLHLMESEGSVYVFMQPRERNLCHVVRMDREKSELIATVRIMPGDDELQNMTGHCHPTDTGVAILYEGRWMHIGKDGSYRHRLLEYPNFDITKPVPIGEVAALLLRGPNQKLRVEVVDLETGVSVIAQDLDAPADRYSPMVANDRWLFVLQDSAREVHRIDLHRQSPVTRIKLPFVPYWPDLQQARAFDDGVAMPTNRSAPNSNGTRGDNTIAVVRPEQPLLKISLRDLEFGRLSTKDGIGWWTRPLRNLRSQMGPLTLNWLEPGTKRPWQHTFPVTNVRIPRIISRSANAVPPRDHQLLVIQPGARDYAELHCLELGAGSERWVAKLSNLPFSGLADPYVAPRRGSDGWAILLRESNPRRAEILLHTYLIDDTGTLVDHYVTPSLSTSRYAQELYLLNGLVVLRNAELLTLLGKK